MSLEMLICIIGFIVLTYFMAKPKSEIKKDDKLTEEIDDIKGLPAPYPPNTAGGWLPPH